MNNIKLIAMDLDGTALQADRCSFSPRLNDALEAAYDAGVTIVPVTGRQFGLLPPAVQRLPRWSGLAVLCNGAQIRRLSTGEELFGLNIPREALPEIHTLAEQYGLPLEISLDSRLHLTRTSYEMQRPEEKLRFHVHTILENHGVIVDSLLPLCQRSDVEKVMLPHIPDPLKEEVKQALDKLPISAVWSGPNSIEISHRDATKGNALDRLSRLLEIPVENMLALGDSGNDISMLRRAGLGIAMGNASETVRAAADAVTESYNNDGAAIAIEQYVLQKSI